MKTLEKTIIYRQVWNTACFQAVYAVSLEAVDVEKSLFKWQVNLLY